MTREVGMMRYSSMVFAVLIWSLSMVTACGGDDEEVTTEAGSTPETGDFILTEFLVNGSADCADGNDWIELVNVSNKMLSFKSCMLSDDKGNSNFLIPLNVAPGQHVVLTQSYSPMLQDMEMDDFLLWKSKPNLNKDHDSVSLKCLHGTEETVLFTIRYGKSGEIDAPKDTEEGLRTAMQLHIPAIGKPTMDYAEDPKHWCAASRPMTCGDYGTPGVTNPPCDFCSDVDCGKSECTDDGCCPCPDGLVCIDGVCGTNEPFCEGRECGDDGTGGNCGKCPEGYLCVDGPGVCARTPSPWEIIPTEFRNSGSADCFGGKGWVEVLNLTQERLLLTGCWIGDTSSQKGSLEESAFLEPGEQRIIVQGNPEVIDECLAGTALCWGGTPKLNASDDIITLVCNETEIFLVEYGLAEQIEEPGVHEDGAFVSVQLAPPQDGEYTPAYVQNFSNWCPAAVPMDCGDWATAGAANTTCAACAGIDCSEVECTADGCCACPEGQACLEEICTAAVVSCEGKACGDDGAGGSCGECGEGQKCIDGQCLTVRAPAAWEVIPTEIQNDGSELCSGKKDWLEILNVSAEMLTLEGCILKDNAPTKFATIDEPVLLAPGEHLVLVQSSGLDSFPATSVFYYGGNPNFNQDTETIHLLCGDVEVFKLEYGKDPLMPPPVSYKLDGTSISMQLDLSNCDAGTYESCGTNSANWCLSSETTAIPTLDCGDIGSPGQPNLACP
jgi:hypothetical protein